MKNNKPIIKEVGYSLNDLNQSISTWQELNEAKYLLRYPTVYIINDEEKKNDFKVYVG